MPISNAVSLVSYENDDLIPFQFEEMTWIDNCSNGQALIRSLTVNIRKKGLIFEVHNAALKPSKEFRCKKNKATCDIIGINWYHFDGTFFWRSSGLSAKSPVGLSAAIPNASQEVKS